MLANTILAQIISVTIESNRRTVDNEKITYNCQAWQFTQDGEVIGFLVGYHSGDIFYKDLQSASDDNILFSGLPIKEIKVTGEELFTRSQIKKIIGHQIKENWTIPDFAWALAGRHF